MLSQLIQVGLLSTIFSLGAKPLNKGDVYFLDGNMYVAFDIGLINDYTIDNANSSFYQGLMHLSVNSQYTMQYTVEFDYYDNFESIWHYTSPTISFSVNNLKEYYGDVKFTFHPHYTRWVEDARVWADTYDLYYQTRGESDWNTSQLLNETQFTNPTPLRTEELDNTYYFYLPFDLINGYISGYSQVSYDEGYNDGKDAGYQEGYTAGIAWADNQSAVATSIFVGIIDVALLPINFFLACLNFEVFGINIGSMVTALLTIMIVIIIVRVIFSGGNKK